jgi:hypothetical protein
MSRIDHSGTLFKALRLMVCPESIEEIDPLSRRPKRFDSHYRTLKIDDHTDDHTFMKEEKFHPTRSNRLRSSMAFFRVVISVFQIPPWGEHFDLSDCIPSGNLTCLRRSAGIRARPRCFMNRLFSLEGPEYQHIEERCKDGHQEGGGNHSP